jgi:hypothetical protein
MPRIRQIQKPLRHTGVLQFVHIARLQRKRHRPRHVHTGILELTVNKQRHWNQPARPRLGQIARPLIHPHSPHHVLGLGDLMGLSPGTAARNHDDNQTSENLPHIVHHDLRRSPPTKVHLAKPWS